MVKTYLECLDERHRPLILDHPILRQGSPDLDTVDLIRLYLVRILDSLPSHSGNREAAYIRTLFGSLGSDDGPSALPFLPYSTGSSLHLGSSLEWTACTRWPR